MYILFGENETEINNYIENILKKEKIEDKITYNYNECKIEDVIEEAGYFDLFGNKKVIVVNESDFLTSKSTLENTSFENYIKKPNENAILIFKIITDKLDERKKLVKALKEKATIKEFKLPDEKNINNYINNYFENKEYKIDKNATNEIINRLKNNTKVINSELEKLEIYKYDTKIITIEDVKKVITKYEENNIFKLVDSVVKRNKKEAFTLYKKLIEEKEEPTVILILLANQFRLMYQARVLNETGMDKYKIAASLKEHHYRVELSLENSRNIKKEKILELLYKLSEIDIKIKTGIIDKTNSLETFFLEL